MVTPTRKKDRIDQLAALGAKAILTTDIRSCRAMKSNGDSAL